VTTIEPERYFSFKWHPYPVDPDTDYAKETPTLVEFTLTSVDGGTRLHVIESGFDAIPEARRAEAFMKNDGGWSWQLGNIRDYAEGRHAA
jgi:uncharacterized protein YndB with AHSA1/START domain